MIFTLGNILTFFVLLGVILIFRQLDSKNRSIDKVKKFTDKIRSELDEYFDKRSSALRDAALDLEVKQTQAIATVKRLESQRSDFARDDGAISEKITALTKIEASIKSYDEVIEQLMGMTDRADENLQKIAVETNRLDKTQKKVSELHEKLDKISGSIPQVTADFARQNSEQMQLLGSGIISSFEAKAAALQGRFEASETRCSDLLASIENSVQTAFTEAARQASQLENAAFESLQKDIRDRIEALAAVHTAAIEDASRSVEERLERSISSQQNEIERLSSLFEESSRSIEEQISQTTLRHEGELAGINAAFEEKIGSAMQLRDDTVAALQDSLREQSAELRSRLEEEIALAGNAVRENLAALEGRARQESSTCLEAVRAEITDFKVLYDGTAANLQTSLDELSRSAERKIADLTELFERSGGNFTALANEYAENVSSLEQTFQTRFSRFEQGSAERFTAVENESAEKIAALRSELEARIVNLLQTGGERLKSFTEESEGRLGTLEKDFASRLDMIEQNSTRRIDVLAAQGVEKADHLENSLETRFSAISGRLENYAAELEAKISGSYLNSASSIEKAQAAVFADIEKHFDAYKSEMLYRFERMEKTASDIDQLDAQLYETMELTKNRVTDDFRTFAADQEKRQTLFEKSVQDKAQGLSQYMQRIERELAELKSSAYENVSEKLKVFEDDFFADLGKRGDAINTAFIEWKAELENRLNLLAADSEDERRSMEVKYSEDVKAQFVRLNEKVREQLARFDETIKKSEQEGMRRIGVSEETVAAFIERTRLDFEQARTSTEEYLRRELEKYTSAAQEQVKKQQAEIAAHIGELAEETASARSGASAALDAVRDDFILWRERVNQQFEEARAVFEEKIASLEANSAGLMNQVTESFHADAESYARAAQEEKAKLSVELDSLRQSMKDAVQGFQARSGETVEEFRASYESMLEETQRRIREQNSESEQKLRTLKQMAQEIQEKNEEARQKMVLKMQTDTSNLQMVMDDISKRLKDFTAQTQLFERADSLKTHLEEQIAALRADTATLDSFRQSASELEQQFIKIRRMDDEMSQKLQRFGADRKRIEAMETDFNNLMALSASIDQKISELKSTGDDLQQIQLEVRRFQENLADIGARYERLEKKNDILERTIMGVDKTFETLSQLEKRLASCSQQTDQLPLRLSELNGAVDRILENDGRIQDAAAKLDSLDTILSETDNKMKDLLRSREWLAKTETRLEEINKQAQSQVKILGDLLKKDGVKGDSGAPPISVRETVTKLAHQGWKIDEIARGTHLSRGEVELILELGNDQK